LADVGSPLQCSMAWSSNPVADLDKEDPVNAKFGYYPYVEVRR
jgi:hypothetical protein